MWKRDSSIYDVKGRKSKGIGKGRTPCCDKAHVNRGSWSPAEDLRLISFIQKYGHDNWRALPKQAGLLRCGKSCRLRWVNYLRPDLKRGNFSKEEEETIIRLHQSYGNKWSRIAAHLPGRTDNEIKNVWNIHIKKRLGQVASSGGLNGELSILTPSSSSSSVKSDLNQQMIEIDSHMSMLPHFSVMKTNQMDFPNINYAPSVNQMVKQQEDTPFNDFGSMEQFLGSNGLDQLEDSKIWEDPNLLDSFLNVADDEDPKWELPPPNTQLDSTDTKSTHELVMEPDFDIWSILNYDVVAKLDDTEAGKVHNAEVPMNKKNFNSANNEIIDQDTDSLSECFENHYQPTLPQISMEMWENPDEYQCSVLKYNNLGTTSDTGVQEMMDMDYYTVWPPSTI